MARRKTKKIRYDSCGRVLNKGESQRPDGRYMFQWTDELSKKRMTRYADTLQDLRREEAKIEADARDGIQADAANITFNALFEHMLESKTGLKESTRRTYLRTYCTYIKDSLGNRKVQSIRPLDIEELYRSIIGHDGTSHSGSTITLVSSVLSPVFKSAVRNDLIRRNPCDGVLSQVISDVGWRPKKKTAVSERDIGRFLAFAESRSTDAAKGFLPAIKVMLLTGCRASEVLGLTVSDVDFQRHTITIDHVLNHLKATDGRPSEFVIADPKTVAGERVVPMSTDCAAAVREAIEFMLSRRKKVEVDGLSGFIFVNSKGCLQDYSRVDRFIHDTVSRFNEEEMKTAKEENREPELMQEFSCHQLRHTFASRAVEANVNPKLLQTVLGHSKIATTMDVYASFRAKQLEEAFNEIRDISCLA